MLERVRLFRRNICYRHIAPFQLVNRWSWQIMSSLLTASHRNAISPPTLLSPANRPGGCRSWPSIMPPDCWDTPDPAGSHTAPGEEGVPRPAGARAAATGECGGPNRVVVIVSRGVVVLVSSRGKAAAVLREIVEEYRAEVWRSRPLDVVDVLANGRCRHSERSRDTCAAVLRLSGVRR